MAYIRQPIITVLGHVDHGKCIHPDELVFTEQGPKKAKELVDSNISPRIVVYKEKVKESNNYKKVKLEHKGSLIKIALEDGSEIRVTPEHPLLTADGWKSASEITENDKVAVILEYPLNKTFNDFKNYLLKRLIQNKESIFILSEEATEVLRSVKYWERFRGEDIKILLEKYGLDYTWNSIKYFGFTTRKQRAGHIKRYVSFPKDFNTWRSIFYLVGLFYADGVSNANIIANNDKTIQSFVKQISKNIGLYSEVKDGRTVQMIEIKGAKLSFLKLLKYIFEYPEKKKVHNIKIPEILWHSPKEFIGAFVGGVIDGDGYIDTRNYNIEIVSASKQFIYGLKYLLLTLGVFSKIIEKGRYYRLIISGKRNLENLARYILLVSKRKQFEMILLKSKKDNITVPLSPLYLKYLRLSFGLTKSEVAIPYYKNYEEGKQRLTLYIWKKFVDNLKPKRLDTKIKVLEGKIKDYNLIKAFQSDGLLDEEGKLTPLGREFLKIWKEKLYEKIHIPNFEEVVFIKVKKVEENPYDGYVYDLSTDTMTFIANGIVVHNTTLLDQIRKTAIAQKEAGGITQHIGATEVPIDVVKKLSEPIKDILKFDLKIPGLLFIDTPGHEAFSNLRRRGGSIADLAIIVIDINEGVMPQTKEAIEICKQFKVPFVVAANKIDKIPGWETKEKSFIKNYQLQSPKAQAEFETRLYNLVSQLYELGFDSELFTRVKDFTKQVAIVPISAKTGEGLPELLLLVAGLAQKFLAKRLEIDPNAPGKGVILEKKKEKGIEYIDVILYDGVIREGDQVAFYSLEDNAPIITKIRGLFKAAPLTEIRDRGKFIRVKEAIAAAGVRVLTPDNQKALAGSPIYVVTDENKEEILQRIKEEVGEIIFEFEGKEGLVVKADTLGTLEAIINILKNKGIAISKAGIGDVTKKDILWAQAQKDEKYKVILAFNVGIAVDSIPEDVKIIKDNVIYRLLDKYEEYLKELEEKEKRLVLESLAPAFKIEILPGYVFRRRDPAIVGVRVLGGTLKPGAAVMTSDGRVVGRIKSIQKEGKSVKFATKGEEVAVAIEGVTVGRQVHEGDILYSYLPEEDFKEYKKHKDILTQDEKETLKEIAKIMRQQNTSWGL